ncbi:MAG: heme exporter protein CcmB [Myxococcota bacterium]
MRTLAWMLQKDLLVEWRARARAVGLAAFAGTTLLLFSFAVGPDSAALRQHASAYLWLSLLLSSSLLLERSFRIETESSAIDTLLLLPTPPAAIFLGKALANGVQLVLLAAVAFPLTVALFDAPLRGSPVTLGLVAALGAAGLAAPGTLYAALTARAGARQLMLPLLLFPLVVPCLLAAVKATTLVMLGDPMRQLGDWIGLLVSFDVLFWALCSVLFAKVVEG